MYEYLLPGLGIIAGLLLLYGLLLKASENDWTVQGRVPPGPTHLPFIGSLCTVLRAGPLQSWVEGLFATHGPVVRVSLPGRRVVVAGPGVVRQVAGPEAVRPGPVLQELPTPSYLLHMLARLGLPLKVPAGLTEDCDRLSGEFHHFTVSAAEFAGLMESAEHYRSALHEVKVRALLRAVLGRPVAWGPAQRDLVSRGFHEMEKFKEELMRSSPAVWLPLSTHYLERKRLSRSMEHLRRNLTQLFSKCGGPEGGQLWTKFLVVYLLLSLSSTSPKKTKRPEKVVDAICCDKAVPKPCSNCGEHPNSILTSEPTERLQGFDLAGFRFFHSLDYITLEGFDIPGNTLIISSETTVQA